MPDRKWEWDVIVGLADSMDASRSHGTAAPPPSSNLSKVVRPCTTSTLGLGPTNSCAPRTPYRERAGNICLLLAIPAAGIQYKFAYSKVQDGLNQASKADILAIVIPPNRSTSH